MVRTKLQSEQLKYSQVLTAVQHTVREGGMVRSLYRGLTPTLLRDVPFSGKKKPVNALVEVLYKKFQVICSDFIICFNKFVRWLFVKDILKLHMQLFSLFWPVPYLVGCSFLLVWLWGNEVCDPEEYHVRQDDNGGEFYLWGNLGRGT